MLTIVTEPTLEPVELADVKSHLSVEVSDDDTMISNFITAARRWCEHFTRRAFITQSWKLVLDKFPAEFRVPLPPLQSVTSITYIDTDGNTQTLASSVYTVDIDSEPGRIVEAYQQSWPTTRDVVNAVTVTYKAGYGAASTNMPGELKLAIKMLVGHYYENREAFVAAPLREVPMASEHLLWPLRAWNEP